MKTFLFLIVTVLLVPVRLIRTVTMRVWLRPVFIFLLLLMLIPTVAFAADDVTAPEIPQELQLAIGLAVTWAVVNGLKALAEKFNIDLQAKATGIVVILTALVVFNLNSIIQLLVTADSAWGPRLEALFGILVIIIGAMGLKRAEVKARIDSP